MPTSPALESMARQICETKGPDLDAMVTVEVLARLAGEERMAWHIGPSLTPVTVPRWMTYRSHAEKMAKPE